MSSPTAREAWSPPTTTPFLSARCFPRIFLPISEPPALDIGSRGQKVEQLQEQLNAISNNYPLIPKIRVDGIYGEETQRAVEIFQDIFGLPETGEVDYRTWYKVQEIYVGVTRIAELY